MENQNQEKYLFHLTVNEYGSLLKKTLGELLPQMIQEELESLKELIELEQKPGKDTIPLEEAAEMTGLKPKSIYSKVSRLEMPSLTRGRPLMFSRKQLSAWMRDGKPTVTEMNYKEYMKKRNKLR